MLEEIHVPNADDESFKAVDIKAQTRETADPQARKRVEEEIDRKKEILQKLVLERESKTKDEIAVLNKVKVDLEKIDMLIDQDVVILRSKIDNLAVEVAQAHSFLAKKEKEYLQAKRQHDKKFNEKRMLTDHLNLIIFENEKKKELKLAELMEKLNASTNDGFTGWDGFKDEKR